MSPTTQSPRYVVLADVVGSRDIDDRPAFQQRLLEALDDVNDLYGDAVHTDFEIIKGVDEFGGVLGQLAPIYEVLATVLNRIHPVRVRFGIASGEFDVDAETASVSEMDGRPFHRADELLAAAEADELYAGIDTGSPVDPLVSNNLNLLLVAREHLTEHQVTVERAYERHGTQAAAAAELDVPQQSVSKALQRADYDRRKRLRETLRDALEVVYDS